MADNHQSISCGPMRPTGWVFDCPICGAQVQELKGGPFSECIEGFVNDSTYQCIVEGTCLECHSNQPCPSCGHQTPPCQAYACNMRWEDNGDQ